MRTLIEFLAQQQQPLGPDLKSGLGSVGYGLAAIGPGVGIECHVAQNGLHGWEDHFLFEVIDPETLKPLPMGSTGELVITTLTKEALPMIRYRTRDITRLSAEPCACGRSRRTPRRSRSCAPCGATRRR